MLLIDLKDQSFRVQADAFVAEQISTHYAHFLFFHQTLIQIACVGCRVPGGPRLDDLFVTTVKTFWQVRLNPLQKAFHP